MHDRTQVYGIAFSRHQTLKPGLIQTWKSGTFAICSKIFGHIVNCYSLEGKPEANWDFKY